MTGTSTITLVGSYPYKRDLEQFTSFWVNSTNLASMLPVYLFN